MIHLPFALFVTTLLSIANPQDKQPPTPPAQAAASAALVATVPSTPNVSCPIMGKPISAKLYIDTELGRIWVCCKSCYKDILADTAAAHKTAYPVVQDLKNAISPVSGKPIEIGAPRLRLQGYEFAVASADEVKQARESSQIVLAKLLDQKLVDLGNTTCPVTAEPVGKNSFVVVDGTIVRLSSDKALAAVTKEPAKVLAAARKLREQEKRSEPARKP